MPFATKVYTLQPKCTFSTKVYTFQPKCNFSTKVSLFHWENRLRHRLRRFQPKCTFHPKWNSKAPMRRRWPGDHVGRWKSNFQKFSFQPKCIYTKIVLHILMDQTSGPRSKSVGYEPKGLRFDPPTTLNSICSRPAHCPSSSNSTGLRLTVPPGDSFDVEFFDLPAVYSRVYPTELGCLESLMA